MYSTDMNEWMRGDKIQYFGGEGVVLSVESTEKESPILTVISDGGELRQLDSDLGSVLPQ